MDVKEIAIKLNNEYGDEFLKDHPDFVISKSELTEMIELTMMTDLTTLSDLDVELILNEWSKIVDFNWNNYALIARLLNINYPEADLITIRSDDIEEYVMQLDNYNPMIGSAEEDQLDAILYSWINELGDEFDDSMHDPYV